MVKTFTIWVRVYNSRGARMFYGGRVFPQPRSLALQQGIYTRLQRGSAERFRMSMRTSCICFQYVTRLVTCSPVGPDLPKKSIVVFADLGSLDQDLRNLVAVDWRLFMKHNEFIFLSQKFCQSHNRPVSDISAKEKRLLEVSGRAWNLFSTIKAGKPPAKSFKLILPLRFLAVRMHTMSTTPRLWPGPCRVLSARPRPLEESAHAEIQNWIRVRKGARPAGPRLQIEQLRTDDRRLVGRVSWSIFLCLFVLFYCYFTKAAPTDLSSRKKEQVLGFFLSSITEKMRQPRFLLCDFGCGIRRSGSRSNHWPSMSDKKLVRMFVIMQLTHRPKEREI